MKLGLQKEIEIFSIFLILILFHLSSLKNESFFLNDSRNGSQQRNGVLSFAVCLVNFTSVGGVLEELFDDFPIHEAIIYG